MAKNIGKLAVQLTADARPLAAAVSQARTLLSGMSAQAAQVAKATSAASMAVKTLGVAAVGLAAAAPVLWLKNMAEGMEQTDRQARKLGVSIGELRGLNLAGGAAAQEMAQAVGLLNLNLARAAQGDLAAAGLFAGVGGTAGLTGGPAGLAQVLDRLAGMPDAAHRAAQAFRTLGPAAGELLPFLGEGGGGVRAAQEQARRMGLFVGENDIKTARDVANIFREIKALWEGVQNQFFLAIAPLVAELRSRLDFSGIDLSGLREQLLNVIDTVGLSIAKLMDGIADGSLWAAFKTAGVDAVKAISAEVATSLTPGIAKNVVLITSVAVALGMIRPDPNFNPLDTNKLGPIPKADAVIAEEKVNQKQGDFVRQWAEFMGGVRGRTGGNMAGPGAAGWGGINAQAMLAPFVQEVVQQFSQALGAANQGRPLVGLQQAMNNLGTFGDFGLFQGLPGARERMAADAFLQFRQGVGAAPQQFAGAALENTRDAYSAIIRHQDPNRRISIQEEMKALAEEAKRADEEKLRIGRETLEAIQKQGGKVMGL